MKEKYLLSLSKFYYLLPQADNIWLEPNKPIKATKIIVFSADMDVVFKACEIYHLMRKNYGEYPIIYCLNEENMFDNVGECQRVYCRNLGVSKGRLIGYQDADKAFLDLEMSQEQAIFVMPFVYHKAIRDYVEKRYCLNAVYYAPAEGPDHGLEKTMRYDNLMALMRGKFLVREIVSLYDSSTFTGIDPEIVKQLRNMLRKFREVVMLHCPEWRLKLTLWWHKKKIIKARQELLKQYQRQLKEMGFNY